MDQFNKTIIRIPDNWLGHIGAIVGQGGSNIHNIRNFAAPGGKGIKIFVQKDSSGRSQIEISTFVNDSTAKGKIMRATHKFEDLFKKQPGVKSSQKKVIAQKPTQNSNNRFVVHQQQDEISEKGVIDWSDDDSSEEEDEPLPPPKKVVTSIRLKRFNKRQKESAEVDKIMAQYGLDKEPQIESFVTN